MPVQPSPIGHGMQAPARSRSERLSEALAAYRGVPMPPHCSTAEELLRSL